MYLNNEFEWWSDSAYAMVYPTKEEAEAAAFKAVTANPSFIGSVQVEQVIGGKT